MPAQAKFNKDNEFEQGKGRKGIVENFGLNRAYQKIFPTARFTASYIKDCYSTAPQAIFKIVSYGKGVVSAKQMLEYAFNRDQENLDKSNEAINENDTIPVEQEFYTQDGEVLKGQADINKTIDEWSLSFRDIGSGKGNQRHITHLLLSADVDQTTKNSNKVLNAAQETLWQHFGEVGYEYRFVLHTDTDNPHVHAYIKNYNDHTKTKLRIDRYDCLNIRSNFAKALGEKGLKTHIATLRRDRPDVIRRVTDNISQIKSQITRMDDKLDACQFYNRKNQLNAQLTKTKKQYDYSNIQISINRKSSNRIQIATNKVGKPFEQILKNIAINDIGNKRFNIDTKGDKAAINLIRGNDITQAELDLIKSRVVELAGKKERLQMTNSIKRTTDQLPIYRSTLIRTNKSIAWVKKSNLSNEQKLQATLALKTIKKQLLTNYNLKDMYDASTFISAEANEKIAKELITIDKKPKAKDFYYRRKALLAYIEQQKEQIVDKIKFYQGEGGNKEIVKLLRGMQSAKGYERVLKNNKELQKNISNRGD